MKRLGQQQSFERLSRIKRLQQQSFERLSRLKRLRWILLFAVILISSTIWIVYKTEFLAGFWGLKNDEIAVVTIDREKDNLSTQPKTITVVAPNKSFWDGLQLLGVPVVLVVLGAWFQRTQREQDEDEAREEVLQLYFDRISTLLIEKNLMTIAVKKEEAAAARIRGILTGSSNTEQEDLLKVAIDVIQARTLSILRRFEQDSKRKSSVIRFLADAGVINKLNISLSGTNLLGASLIKVSLVNADLKNTNLSQADLLGSNLCGEKLCGANLSKSRLIGTNLLGVDLSNAILDNAKLSFVNLSCINLRGAELRGADLHHANLSNADLQAAILVGSDLSGADLSGADLSYVNLSDTDLSYAKLGGAKLFGAKLCGANLADADLHGANLMGADLRGVKLLHSRFPRTVGLCSIKLFELLGVSLDALDLDALDLRKAREVREAKISEALLCNTQLPKGIGLSPDRDCEKLRKEIS